MNENEKKAEELLQLLGNELARSRDAAMEPISSLEREPVPIKKEKNRKKWGWKQVCALMICCLLLTVGVTTVSSDAAREKLFGFVFDDKDGYSDLVRSESTEPAKTLYPTYLPKGYEKTEEQDFGAGIEIIYENKKTGEFIHLSQITDTDIEESFDTETTTRQTCLVNDCEAYFLGGDETHILIWERNGVYMELVATLDKETMIRIGSSLR